MDKTALFEYERLTQALQILAIAPCILVIFYLSITSVRLKFVILPIFYFVALAFDSLYYMEDYLFVWRDSAIVNFILLMATDLMPVISFLLIIQFVTNKLPKWQYWLILPFVAIESAFFAYIASVGKEYCFTAHKCFNSDKMHDLNHVIVASLVFLLLVFALSKAQLHNERKSKAKKNKYWMIITLLGFNVLFLINDLLYIQNYINEDKYKLVGVIMKITFVYLVGSSIFRIFTDLFDINHMRISYAKMPLTQEEETLANKIEQLLNVDKIYREMNIDRAYVASLLETKEHILSRIINMRFKKSFSALINDFRINEAKDLIENTDQAITVISFDTGFSSITSFNRVFKDYTGMAPSKYREVMRK